MTDLRRLTTIRGLRNNNPGNIRISDTPWQGKIPKAMNTDKNKAFEQFESLEYGLRALMKNAYPEVNKLVEEYLEARLKVDKAEISKMVDNVNYAGIEELPKIMKNFESIKLDDCYTIDGPEENAKMVYAKTEIKIKGIDTTASSIDGFYVRADEGGDYKIILSPLPDEVQKIIDADIKRDDVSALLSDVNTQFAREIKSDNKLADFFSKLQNREAGSNEEIKVSDGKDDAKSTKQKKEKSGKKSESSKKNTKSKKSKKK